MTTIREIISRLPELPVEAFEVAGKLAYSDRVPIITIRPHELPTPKEPPIPTPLVKKSEFFVRKYLVQITYPRVMCVPPPEPGVLTPSLFAKGQKNVSDMPESDVITIAKEERFYKLSKLNGNELTVPFWCWVTYGPWTAVIVETESCTSGVPNFWQLFAFVTDPVSLSWYGHWEDLPSYPSLHVIMGTLQMLNEARQCCPGYRWCTPTMSCIPLQVNCQDQIPV